MASQPHAKQSSHLYIQKYIHIIFCCQVTGPEVYTLGCSAKVVCQHVCCLTCMCAHSHLWLNFCQPVVAEGFPFWRVVLSLAKHFFLKMPGGGARRQPAPTLCTAAVQECLSGYLASESQPFQFGCYNMMQPSQAASGMGLLGCGFFLRRWLKYFPDCALCSKQFVTVLANLVQTGSLSRFPIGHSVWETCNILDESSREMVGSETGSQTHCHFLPPAQTQRLWGEKAPSFEVSATTGNTWVRGPACNGAHLWEEKGQNTP